MIRVLGKRGMWDIKRSLGVGWNWEVFIKWHFSTVMKDNTMLPMKRGQTDTLTPCADRLPRAKTKRCEKQQWGSVEGWGVWHRMESEARKAGWGQIRQYLVPLSQELPFSSYKQWGSNKSFSVREWMFCSLRKVNQMTVGGWSEWRRDQAGELVH